MSHHSTVSDPQTDVTDLFIFQKPGDSSRSILIMNVHPFVPVHTIAFSSEASYEFKIDTNRDAQADIAFHILFSSVSDAPGGPHRTARVYRSVGVEAQGTGALGEMIIRDAPVSLDDAVHISAQGDYRFYAGLRSDPWFADVDGVINNFQFTGKDTFGAANVFGVVLELLNAALGPTPRIGIWARSMAVVDGKTGQVDQVGRPLVPAVFFRQQTAQFVETPPDQQRASFMPGLVASLQSAGYTETDATRIAEELLPDILQYDYTRPAGYPNGRRLTDDLLDAVLSLATNGQVTTDLVGPHTDLLNEFPYLGSPHPA